MCIIEHSRNIYQHLADKQSRIIYLDRMNYSLTGDMSFIEGLVDKTVRRSQSWSLFCESLRGAEAEALRGAARVIKEQKPKLAISVYHKERDIWEIPALILSYCPEYKFYLRHYSFSWYDTILYAVAEEAEGE